MRPTCPKSFLAKLHKDSLGTISTILCSFNRLNARRFVFRFASDILHVATRNILKHEAFTLQNKVFWIFVVFSLLVFDRVARHVGFCRDT